MFRVSTKYHKFSALLLTAVLFCSSLACLSICSEITEPADSQNTICIKAIGGENECPEISGISKGCPLTISPSAIQERPTIFVPALINTRVNYQSQQGLEFVPSPVPDSNINQHSPPPITPRLYLRLGNFRI